MNIDRLIQIKSNDLKPAKGRVLLSEPFMGDYYFGRSVVLLAEHNKEGSMGIILNKPISTQLNDVVQDFPEIKLPLYLGGPVENNRLFYIHTIKDKISDSIEVAKNLYWGGKLDDIIELANLGLLNNENIRFFIGYSGWSGQQLDSELKKNSWAITPITASQIFHIKPELLWKKLTRQLGADYRLWNKFPVNPSNN